MPSEDGVLSSNGKTQYDKLLQNHSSLQDELESIVDISGILLS